MSGTSAANVVGAVVDPETDHDTSGNGKLLKTDQRTADLWRCDFGVVHGNNHGERTDSHTSNETTAKDGAGPTARSRSALDDDADDEDGDVDEDGVFT